MGYSIKAGNDQFFYVNDKPYQRGAYEAVFSGGLEGDETVVTIQPIGGENAVLNRAKIVEIEGDSGNYASADALRTALQSFFFRKLGGGGGGGGGTVTAPNVLFDPAITPYANLQEFAEDVNEKVKAIVYDEAGFVSAMNDRDVFFIIASNRIEIRQSQTFESRADKIITGYPIEFTDCEINFDFDRFFISFQNDLVITDTVTFTGRIYLDDPGTSPSLQVKNIRPFSPEDTSILNIGNGDNTTEIVLTYETKSENVTINTDGSTNVSIKQELWFTSPTPVPYTLTDDLVIFDRDIQVPQNSLFVGDAIKMSDLAQSIGYETAYDKKRYVLIGQEVTDVDSKRPIVKEYTAPSSLDLQPIDDVTEAFTGEVNFNITSTQNVYGEQYLLKFVSDQDVEFRLYRSAENGGVETKVIDELFPASSTSLSGTVLNLSPVVDFELGKVYRLQLTTEGNAQISGTLISGFNPYSISTLDVSPNFVPYIRREIGYVYEEREVAYTSDLSGSITTDTTLKGDGTAGDPLGVDKITQTNIVDGSLNNGVFQNMQPNTFKGRAANIGAPQDLTVNEVRQILNVENYTHPDHSGEVTSVSDGPTTVEPSAISNKPLNSNVSGTEEVLINNNGILQRTPVENIALLNVPESLIYKCEVSTGVSIPAGQTYSNINIFGSVKFSQGSGWVGTPSGVVIPSDGTYKISFSIKCNSTAQRATPAFSPTINGAPTQEDSSSAYIRGTNGIFSASCVLTTEYELSQGDILGLASRRTGTINTATTTDGLYSFISIEKISGPRLNIGVSSLGDLSDVNFSTPPQTDQILKYNGSSFVPADETSGGGGGANVYTVQRTITQSSWSANTPYNYVNIPFAEAEVDDVFTIQLSSGLAQTLGSVAGSFMGIAYCQANGLINVVCMSSTFVNILPNSFFKVQLVK